MLKQARLSKHISRRIVNGHPYVYQNEIDDVKGTIEKGEIIDVFTYSGQFVGKGYYNADSKIIIRLITRLNEKIDALFVKKKLKAAMNYRNRLLSNEKSCRVFNGLSDGISGLTCDRYDELYCVSSSTAGGDKLLDWFIDAIVEMGASKVMVRNTAPSRKKEGIPGLIKSVKGDIGHVHKFNLNGIEYSLNPFSKEDPFFYLEQRQNAVLFSTIVRKVFQERSIRAFDFFSGYGQFGLNLLKSGLEAVEFIDSEALYGPLIKESALQAQLEGFSFHACNAFDYLHRMDIENDKADLIILDPPPFTDSRKKKGKALNAYKEINLRALKILKKGGLLATSCPSQNVSREDLEMMFYAIASDIKHEINILYRGSQPLDFPFKVNIFETDFLKFYVLMKGESL
ncbi:MAG: class I SAM-dependent rRNA methyltransferase [Thermotogota bacterium]